MCSAYLPVIKLPNRHAMKNIFDTLESIDENLTAAQKARIVERLSGVINYTPKIGVFGKTGVGKSSLCNALFGSEICKVSDVKACTREPQEVLLGVGQGKGITLLDVPGVGESQNRDDEYSALYQKLLPELDAILWILKGDDRAYSVDIEFYTGVVKPHLEAGKPFLLVINQVDKIEPFREWNVQDRVPGPKQAANIEAKIADVSQSFQMKRSSVIPVSADEKYGLTKLVDELIFSLPDEKKLAVAREVEKDNLSSEAKKEVKQSFERVVKNVVRGAVAGAALGSKIAGPVGAAVGGVIGGVGAFFGLW